MTYEMYRSVFVIAAVAAGVMAVISIFLFFWLKIPAVIGDLSGATARKGIEAIRSGNAKSGNKKYGSSKVNLQRGRLTAKMTHTGSLETLQTDSGYGLNTEKLKTDETTVLSENQTSETTVLSQNQMNGTTLLSQSQINETTVLSQSQINETTVLSQSQINETTILPSGEVVFEILQDITIIHTEEMIELI